ncbi:hypothetical protein [Corallococcus sicarius]|uniref:hypothetical protein n=1 Tax=Corallococcus sicarius TaxID=2316726 RepID=UPI0011C3B1A3|nr:hypothetical protein [Corallococcus sicarius]
MKQEESVIVCEGYHDRAFWDGWLRHLGCNSLRTPSKNVVKDPWGNRVTGGQYGYESASGEFVRIVPCGGDDFVPEELRTKLSGRATKKIRQLVVNYDADSDARVDAMAGHGIQSALQSVENIVKEFDPQFTRSLSGDFLLDGGTTTVSVVVWWTPDPHAPGLPWKHTLERLVCASLSDAFPGRAGAVEQWLASRPMGPTSGPKEYAWSNMAGWYAEKGCEAFYSSLWDAPQVVTALKNRLLQAGAWQVAQAAAS